MWRIIGDSANPPRAQKLFNIILGVTAIAIAIKSVDLAISSNYGGHHDIYLMLGSFLSVLHDGVYIPSRFTGYPVAEVGIGASAWLGGSALSNAVNYGLFLASILIFPYCFDAKPTLPRYLTFACMALSSTVLAFDNIISIDYPWATFFWVIGCAILKNSKARSNSIIPMALAIGSRPVFALFAISSIYLIDNKSSPEPGSWFLRLKERLSITLTTIFAGGLFYLPAWFRHNFGLSWISAEPPDNQGLIGLAGRFILKLLQAFGLVQTVIIIVIAILVVIAKQQRNQMLLIVSRHDVQFVAGIVILNLLIFARMPVQLSYLQPLLLCCFYMLSRLRNTKLAFAALMIIGLNLLNWYWQPKIVKIDYESDKMCSKTVAKGAKIHLWVDDGRILEFEKSARKARCYRGWFGQIKQADYSSVIINGRPLRMATDTDK